MKFAVEADHWLKMKKRKWINACGVTVIVVGMNPATRVQTWKLLIAFHIARIPFWEGMNPFILTPGMGKKSGRLGSLALGNQSWRKETLNSNEFNFV